MYRYDHDPFNAMDIAIVIVIIAIVSLTWFTILSNCQDWQSTKTQVQFIK